MMVKWLIGAVVLYAGFVALLYLAQRSLQYFPERRRTTPAGGLACQRRKRLVLDTADGEHVIVWHVPPRRGSTVFLYFHGNGGSLRWRDERFRALIADGSGLVALSTAAMGARADGRPRGTHRGRSSGLCVRHCPLSRRAHRPMGRIARLCARGSVSSRKASRQPGAGGPLHLGGRCRRSALLVRPGTVIHEGQVPFRFARQQG